MKLIFAERAWEDYLYWQEADRRLIVRINTSFEKSSASRSAVSESQSR